jgi:hypothetical protein
MGASAGWYPDPSGAAGQRYFDGAQWTEHRVAAHKSSKTGLWVLIGIMVLAFGSCATLMSMTSKVVNENTNSSAASTPTAPIATQGQPVRDGQFEFVVTAVNNSGGAGSSRPRGVYVVVSMTVNNIGNQSQEFFPENQKLIDTSGRQFEADSMAAMGMNRDSAMVSLNPGLRVALAIPFDVPRAHG